ncbi:neutral alpha-glucosidase ab [Anaeramoeba flamelloides]|uniref:Neutral alpha-glucosidase ab n=1 Tax=Anaeramoeba flamelloides TaxID=1746091 RepID=A0AAV7YKD4_9EUKA|nr:neutral alpha-glucosidase ab [Anaeramoeba flamelloides]
MKNDPITLFVFLDENQQSSGSIFLDDGHSYDFTKLKKYIHQKFIFESNKLFTKSYHLNYKTLRIERIIIANLIKNPNQVIFNNSQLQFVYQEKDQILTIRNPKDLFVGENWEIIFD